MPSRIRYEKFLVPACLEEFHGLAHRPAAIRKDVDSGGSQRFMRVRTTMTGEHRFYAPLGGYLDHLNSRSPATSRISVLHDREGQVTGVDEEKKITAAKPRINLRVEPRTR